MRMNIHYRIGRDVSLKIFGGRADIPRRGLRSAAGNESRWRGNRGEGKTLQPQSVTLTSDLTGRVKGSLVSDVRPQVDGIIQKRLFTEGDEVKEGQALYQIDPASYQATYDEAVGQLKNAVAVVNSSKLKAQRYTALVKENGVSRQDADEAVATWQQNVASVDQYRAAVQRRVSICNAP